jgi:hypothetical protein
VIQIDLDVCEFVWFTFKGCGNAVSQRPIPGSNMRAGG